jgi:hypothetical protein
LPEWLIERGIGETRAALVEDGEILEAGIEPDEIMPAGFLIDARLTDAGREGRNAVATDDRGVEYLLPRGAGATTQGARITIEITRSAIPGNEPWKRPLAKIAQEPKAGEPGGSAAGDKRELTFPNPVDELAEAGWNDLLDEARTGSVRFAGGELRISVTPAMTLIDVDGYLPVDELAGLGAREAALATRRLDIGGSIGVDLPTSSSKSVRQAAAVAIDDILPQPFERTSVNGFGFVQIVRPRRRASIVELAQDRAAFEARALLRRVAFEPPGPKRLVGHPAVVKVIEEHQDWIAALTRQVGGAIQLRSDAALPMSGGYAEKL